jgi:protocatechuate 3,4-dioxygenase beta subunit
MTIGAGVMACLLSGIRADAQEPPGPQTAQAPPARPAPPRDSAAPAKGTAVLKGRVVSDTGRPLRRARITVSSSDLGPGSSRSTSTDLTGRYEIKELPAARYRVQVTRSGFLPLDYGQRRPGEQGRPVQLAEGQTLDKIDFALPRMSVITGRVSDELGEPIEGVTVLAMRSLFFEGRRKLVPVAQAQTDDQGEYRVQKLSPHTYYIMASTKETWTITDNGKETVMGYMPTFFPGLTSFADARRVTVGLGQQVPSIDLSLIPGRAATVSGTAFDSQHRPFSRVTLGDEIRGVGFGSFRGGYSDTVAPDGSFTIVKVPPGEYRLYASRLAGDPAGDPEVAEMMVVVEGTDIDGLSLVGSAGGTVSGRVVVEGATPPKMSAITVTAGEVLRNQQSPTVLGTFRDGSGTGRVKDDGTFVVPHVLGRARFQVTVPDGWMVKAILYGDRDLTDGVTELKGAEELRDVQIVLTDRVTSVSGQLTDQSGKPLYDATVLVFAAGSDKWFESSRSVKAARPDQQGQWRIKGLAPGDYLGVALEYIEDGSWNDPEYLESLRGAAMKFTVAEGQSQSVALKLTIRKQ